jgi:hypothetical protein
MNIAVSSVNHALDGHEIDLNVQHLHESNGATGILRATSSRGEISEDCSLTPRTVSALTNADSKSRPRRPNTSPRHDNRKPDAAAANPDTNSVEAASENLAGQSRVADDRGDVDHDEAALARQIGQLWGSVEFKRRGIRKSRQEIAAYQVDLARELHRYKALLVGSGRSGKWSAFLRQIEMSRATADRYVQRCERSLTQVGENRFNEAISPPTAEDLTRMVNRIKPQLLRILTTADAVEQFMAVLGAGLRVPRSS